MPRGGARKSAAPAVVSKASSYDCSACTFKSDNLKTAQAHILKAHYNQARINDNTPFTDGERITAFINAQKLLKVLKCNLCEKGFRSGLGYKFHQDICGKDESELYRECEVCGKKLKILSLQQHVRTFHMSSTNDEIIDANILTEQKNNELLDSTSGRGSKRSSAIRALEHFKELSDDEDTSASGKKRPRKKSSDGDDGDDDDLFYVTSEEGESELEEDWDDEEDEEEYEGDDRRTRKRRSSSKKSNSKWKAEWADYGEELRWEKHFVYSKEWISYLRMNESPSTYKCLVPLKKHWKMLQYSPANTQSSIIPRYKLTKSMEQSTDNDFKIVAPLQSARNEDSFTFNVGQFVCSAAWAPIPLPTPPVADAADDDEAKPSSSKFSDLLKWSQKQSSGHKRQYLAVATASYFDKVMNIQETADHSIPTPESSLQLWDMGPLASSSGENKPETLDWTPKMALNVIHNWGDIAEMAWCPCGSTYEVPAGDEEEAGDDQNSQRMRRLGLLALACEDGKVRLVSVPHPRQLSSCSYDTNVCWNLEPVAVLGGRYRTATIPVTSISWAGQRPQEQLLGGFADGTIALWRLDSLARCSNEGGECCPDHHEAHLQKVVVPKKIWCSGRRHPVLTVKWLNPMTFITTQSDSCWFWNLRFERPFHELQRNIVQKVETHPLWYNTFVSSDSPINKPNSMLMIKTFCSDEIFEGDTTTTNGSVEALRHHTVANLGKIRCNDMSISPWQYLLAFCSENGELFTTSLLPKPFHYQKIIISHLLYKIRLGDLTSYEGLDAQLNDGDGEILDTKETTTSKKTVSTKKPTSKALVSVAGKKRNQLINGVVDLAESYDDFFQKYYLIFDDAKKVFLGSGRASDRSKKATTTSPSSADYLTKNDLVRLYAITNCIWNPNLPAYSWIFTATKSGICRLVSHPLVNPQNNLNC